MRLRFWPRSLAARTAFVLLVGLVVVQIAGLTIHALDRVDAAAPGAGARNRRAGHQYLPHRDDDRPGAARGGAATSCGTRPGVTAELARDPPTSELPDELPPGQRLLRVNLNLVPLMGVPHWRGLRILADHDRHRLIIAMRIPEGDWLDLTVAVEPLRPWHSPRFLAAFLLMTVTAAGLTVWAVRRLTAPVRTLAAAAEALGRDVNAPPLPEDGPTEVATAAAAFNTMARASVASCRTAPSC